MTPSPFTTADVLPAWLAPLVAPCLDALSGLAGLRRLYDAAPRTSPAFIEDALETLAVGLRVEDADLARIPASGPVVVVANHPHGALDGLAVAAAVRRVRPNVKLLGNELLARIPEMRPHLIAVDAFRPGTARNAGGVRAAFDWLRDGHALVVFPAGEVSHLHAADGGIVDGRWRDGAARLAARAGAEIVPVYLEGGNSRLFMAAGRVSSWLRSCLLPRELLRRRGRVMTLRIGHAVSPRRLAAVGDARSQTAYLRMRTYALAGSHQTPRRSARRRAAPAPIAPPGDPAALAAEIAALPASCELVDAAPWRVLLVSAAQAPHALHEIGRLREIAFRAVGEGTGRPRDLDAFDRHYRHLFVWHTDRGLIGGAYRVAVTDDVMRQHGLRGLYTSTLFRYPASLLRELGPALELGRSFVRPEFQRDYQPLRLLWRGIGALVAAEPRCRTLFGPVSISADYGDTTRHLVARGLLLSRGSLLQSRVAPRRPLRARPEDADVLATGGLARSVEDVDALVRELEPNRRGLPVLLRHYLKLNARVLGFSVDPSFGNALDGLVVVDLLGVDRALLTRYFGEAAASAFLAAHTQTPAGLAADAA